ncbi:MAG: VWA domain-containing protein [bacterium]|jgi:hypothetical protein
MAQYLATYTNSWFRRRQQGNRLLKSNLFLLAVLISFVLHTSFVLYSTWWQVSDVSDVEENVGQLFRVEFRDLESENFISRPSQQQLQQERQIALREQIEQLSELPDMPAEDELASNTPDIFRQALPESYSFDESDWQERDQSAENLISSDLGQQTIEEFDDLAGADVITDTVNTDRISLQGSGTQKRMMANLPAPPKRNDPLISRSLSLKLDSDLLPRVPEMNAEQPPIELPPVTEILPAPRPIRPDFQPMVFREEEEAIQEIKQQFVQLDDLLDVQIFTYHHIGGEGYFQVQIRPIAQDERLKVLPKDVVFVLDASTSIGGRRLSVIKEEIRKILDRLRPEDRFNIVGFKQNINLFTPTLAPVSEQSKKEAWMFLSPLEASGRTDIYTSLQPLVRLGTERARPLVMMMFSDGRPTVGVVNSRRIINDLSRHLAPSTSIYCIGTGDFINRYLLDMLAYRNRGKVAFERSRSELPTVIQSVFNYIENPVLLKVQVFFEGVDNTEVYPKRLADLYMDGELSVWGRLEEGTNRITLRLTGEAFDERKEMIVQVPIPRLDNATYEVARQWAFHKAYHLVGQMVQEGENPVLMQEIKNLSRTYRIGSPYSEETGLN